jgi:hypothetical protein
MKRVKYCQLPKVTTVTGRSSSITHAFVNAIIPVIAPSEAEEREALSILGIDPADIRCAYCGDKSTEWHHLRPLITATTVQNAPDWWPCNAPCAECSRVQDSPECAE